MAAVTICNDFGAQENSLVRKEIKCWRCGIGFKLPPEHREGPLSVLLSDLRTPGVNTFLASVAISQVCLFWALVQLESYSVYSILWIQHKLYSSVDGYWHCFQCGAILNNVAVNAGLEEAQAGIKIAGRNINNLRYSDDTTLMTESEEELKASWWRWKRRVKKLA